MRNVLEEESLEVEAAHQPWMRAPLEYRRRDIEGIAYNAHKSKLHQAAGHWSMEGVIYQVREERLARRN